MRRPRGSASKLRRRGRYKSAEQVEKIHSAMPEQYLMIMQFDPGTAEITKFGDTYKDSDANLPEAQRDAEKAAEEASDRGLYQQFVVVRVGFVKAFTSYAPRR